RPGGIRSYYEARTRLERVGIAFGYELAEDDWKIDVPDLDDPSTWDGSPPPVRRDSVAAAPLPRPGGDGDAALGAGRGGGARDDFVWRGPPGGSRSGGGNPSASARDPIAEGGSGSRAEGGRGSLANPGGTGDAASLAGRPLPPG